MEPSTKKRKLAPKVNTSPTTSATGQYNHDQQSLTQNQHNAVNDAPLAERHDFESFARHLQDAAMLIQRQTEQKSYANVSVLLLSWEEDQSVNKDVTSLEQVLQGQYHFATQQWQIPTVANPSIKLGVQIASFLDAASPDQLLIIYYAGHGYLSSDGHMYWACNAREDAAKLKWDGVKCLIEDAQSDMLLLLDTCAVPNPPTAGSHGVKQGIAACTPEHNAHEIPGRSFTSSVVEALHILHNGRPFTVRRLFEEVFSQRQQQLSRTSSATRDAASTLPSQAQLPFLFTLTPAKSQHLALAPLSSRVAGFAQSNGEAAERQVNSGRDDHLIDEESVADLRFEEARILVCTTFVGEASPDMSFFNQWLQQTPPLGSKITVEGMFLGPPTMLLISMPQSVWNVVQHDKVCCFLGYISSHNMLHLYEKLVGPGVVRPSSREVEDGRILLEAREVAAGTPARRHRDTVNRDLYHVTTSKDRAPRSDRPDFLSESSPSQPAFGRGAQKPEDEVADSAAEMQEAAEQLKALSHVRHRSDETVPIVERLRANLPEVGPKVEHETAQLFLRASDAGAGINDSIMSMDPNSTANSKAKGFRRVSVKQETRCSQCSHAPFKDSSSLRKHIAAAHTRPFPCAFSFAGCTSTFGSKNEWKRHIASQHLCLQYYRCSACPQSAFEGKGSEFNRKDLFTQHLRRMHAPFQVKRAISQGDGQLHLEWEAHVKEMQQSCLVTRRRPPQQAACPKADCREEFGGMNAWDEWTEHVGRHMEKGEGPILGADELLTQWALDEGIIERKADGGGYRLCPNNGSFGSSQGSSGSMLDRKESLTAPFTDSSQLEDVSMTESRVAGGETASTSQATVG